MSGRNDPWGRIPLWHAVPLAVSAGLVLMTLYLGPGVPRTIVAFLAGMSAALSVILAVDDIRRGSG